MKRKRADDERRAEVAEPEPELAEPVAVVEPTPAPTPVVITPPEPTVASPVVALVPVAPPVPAPVVAPAPAAAKKKGLLDTPEAVARAKAVYVKECTPCHTLEDVDDAAPQDYAGWRTIVRRMITENAAEISKADQDLITAYLARTKGGKPKAKATPSGL